MSRVRGRGRRAMNIPDWNCNLYYSPRDMVKFCDRIYVADPELECIEPIILEKYVYFLFFRIRRLKVIPGVYPDSNINKQPDSNDKYWTEYRFV